MSNTMVLLDVFLQSSSEVREPLLAATRLPRGELVLDHPRQAAEFVHAPWAEPRIVVVEEHEGALDRVGRRVELLVPLPHLRGLVPLLLLELRELTVPDHPEIRVVRRDVRWAPEVLVLRPHHRDVSIPKEGVHVVPEPGLVPELDRVRVLSIERLHELLHQGPMDIVLDRGRE